MNLIPNIKDKYNKGNRRKQKEKEKKIKYESMKLKSQNAGLLKTSAK